MLECVFAFHGLSSLCLHYELCVSKKVRVCETFQVPSVKFIHSGPLTLITIMRFILAPEARKMQSFTSYYAWNCVEGGINAGKQWFNFLGNNSNVVKKLIMRPNNSKTSFRKYWLLIMPQTEWKFAGFFNTVIDDCKNQFYFTGSVGPSGKSVGNSGLFPCIFFLGI